MTTERLDLPDNILNAIEPLGPQPATFHTPGSNQSFEIPYSSGATFQEGGMVGPGGVPVRPGITTEGQAPSQTPVDAHTMQMQIQNVMAKNPEGVEQIRQVMIESMQNGELTEQELNMLVQLATVALQNPETYPQIRQYAIEQGFGADDLPQEYDQGLVFIILLAAQSLQGGAQQPRPNMQFGGPLPEDSANPDGTIPINAHEGEFVIPKNVVQEKGTDFFNNLIKPKE